MARKEQPEFDGWAPYYDLIHKGLPGEAEFYVGQAVRIGGPTLELGCGTGRVAIPMAMSGVDVIGLDLSPRMLELCREKSEAVSPLQGSIELVEGDMATFDFHAKSSVRQRLGNDSFYLKSLFLLFCHKNLRHA